MVRTRTWTRVDSFAGRDPEDFIFTIDPMMGTVEFPPAVREHVLNHRVSMAFLDLDELPELARLMAAGCHGELRSTFPPLTPPAWASAAWTREAATSPSPADVSKPHERGLAAAANNLGYRACAWLAFAAALVMADSFGWRLAFLVLAAVMAVFALVTWVAPEPEYHAPPPGSLRESVLAPLRELLGSPGALGLIGVIITFKIGNALALKLYTPFLMDIGFTKTEIGLVAKAVLTTSAIVGGVLGGLWMIRLGLLRSMLLFGAMSRQSRGGTMLPLLFFLAVAMLFPFAVGPDPRLLARTGGGVIWVAALLAAILPLDRLIEPDIELGMFDQWALRGIAEEWIVLIRVIAHWLSFGPPLMLAAILSAALLGLDGHTLKLVELGLLAGTPGLAALGVMVAAVTAGLRGGAALAGLLVIPLAVPLLVFGAGSLATGGESGIALTAAVSLVLLAITPFAAGAAVRAARG